VVTLLIQFPAGRYHATPPDHHVNEGHLEWPPSPWRLLRALLAAGYNTLGWGGGLDIPWTSRPPDVAQALILKLAATQPSYSVPSALSTHTRHYMPLAKFKNGREDPTLVFDTWARLSGDTLAVTWDAALLDAEMALLAELIARLGYLGRSESWISARIAGTDDLVPPANCVPADELAPPGPGWEQVPLLSPQPPAEYDRWREEAVAAALLPLQPQPNKRITQSLRRKQEQATAPYPIDLVACLQADTNWLRGYGWSQPPGSRRTLYWRPSDLLEPGAPHPRPARNRAPSVECMLLSLATDSGNDHALPAVTRTLTEAGNLHSRLVGIAAKIGGYSRVLYGCDENGQPLTGAHEHAHILPLDLDGDGHIEHVLIWAPMLLDHDAQTAIRALRNTHMKGGVGDLKVALEAAGKLDDLRWLPGTLGRSIDRLLGAPRAAKRWQSWTPFVAPRFAKSRGKNSLEGQIRAELLVRGISVDVDVEINPLAHMPRSSGAQPQDITEAATSTAPPKLDIEANRLRHFVRVRRNGPAPPVDCGFSVCLSFAEPVRGPLCLGYGSHFGLGLFKAAKATE
jgi:CRISPR-associated protein Csb2